MARLSKKFIAPIGKAEKSAILILKSVPHLRDLRSRKWGENALRMLAKSKHSQRGIFKMRIAAEK